MTTVLSKPEQRKNKNGIIRSRPSLHEELRAFCKDHAERFPFSRYQTQLPN
jgi:hypothetical protein